MANTKKKAAKNDYQAWWRTRQGQACFAVFYFVLAYILTSLAIDDGSIWMYLLALLATGLGLGHVIHIFVKKNYGKKH